MKFLFILFLILSISLSYAQNNWCGFDDMLQKAYQENPSLENQIYEHFDRIANGQIIMEERVDPIIIPVVVHIIHNGDNGNISDAQVYDAIRMLNEDFNRLNADTVDTRNSADAPFKPIASNVNIEFRLAKIDPNGNCTNGIERRNSAIASYNANDDNAKFYSGGGLDIWDRNKYFNIWVVNSIENFSGGQGVILGYAQFPQWGAADTYGFVVRHSAFGSIGTANGDRTVTHELGHCLGLFHTFQGGCGTNSSSCSSQGDGCCDTPPVNDPHWSCSSLQNFCNEVPNGDYYGFDAYDQFENYMSYSPCQNMFSEDQKAIIMANFTSVGFMINLASQSNQIETGVLQPDVLCNAKFTSNTRVICEGDSVKFSDLSFHGVSNRTWTFSSGLPVGSTDSSVYVTYNNIGTYPVTLNVSDGTNSTLIDSVNYISVLSSTGTALPYSQGFENITSFPDYSKFFVETTNYSNVNWELNTTVSSTGNKCIFLDNFSNNSGSFNSFTSETIDLTSVPSTDEILFSFDYVYSKKTAEDFESLKIFGTTDCGKSWILFKTFTSNELDQGFVSSQPFFPVSNDWSTKIFTIYSLFQTNNFRFKMEFESGGGNNFFIDNINIFPASQLGLNQQDLLQDISVFPNPTNFNTVLNFYSSTQQNIEIVVYNSLGEVVSKPFVSLVKIGSNQFNIESANFKKGIYYININGDNVSKTVKLIKN